jgi:5S rRNA maturation endonuclease (ribonuclease M5)
MMSLSSVERLVEYDESSLKKERMRFKKLKAGQVWRHIKTDLLMRFEAKQCKVWSEEYQAWGATMMYLPCHINGELVGYIKARLEKHDTKPSYINASGKWSKTHGLFPFDYAVKVMKRKKSSTMILVEGPRDALRLLQMGIPAMCILGTQSFSQNKAKLLELAGITRVVLFFDGDEAGIKATEKVKPIVESMLAVRVLKLWSMKGSPWKKVKDAPKPKDAAKKLGLSLWDPGNVDKAILKKIKEKYYG